MGDPLGDLRSEPGRLTRFGSRLSSGVRSVEATRQPFADWWEERNRAAVAGEGPLWLVLGDSTSQGVGASSPEQGWVPRVHERLREETGEPWRVLNLSITGARMVDVIDRQLPALEAIVDQGALDRAPSLVTSFVGANDIQVLWGVRSAGRTARRLVASLPIDSLVAKVHGGPLSRPKANAINRAWRLGRDAGHVHLMQPWDWPSRRGTMARDHFHPSDKGYRYTAEALWPAISDRL